MHRQQITEQQAKRLLRTDSAPKQRQQHRQTDCPSTAITEDPSQPQNSRHQLAH